MKSNNYKNNDLRFRALSVLSLEARGVLLFGLPFCFIGWKKIKPLYMDENNLFDGH